jgi:hypothetical protein
MRVADFDGVIHGSGVTDMARELMLNHPHTRPEHWLYVEDEHTAQIVSSLCLIPWTWRYGDIELKAGEAGIVGTLEAYRRRGLVREMFARHAELLHEGDFDLSQIQGIAYFYRQFGYQYALPLEGGWRVDLHLIPQPGGDQQPPYCFRQATLDDLPSLMRLYAEAADDLSISTVRDEDIWRYLLGPSMQTDMRAETWLIYDGQARQVGYIRIPEHGFGEGLIVGEASRTSYAVALATLQHLKSLAVERNKPYIRLNVPRGNVLVQSARDLGAHDAGTYAWQISVPSVGRLLRKLGPLLEQRLQNSPYAGLSQALCLNLYREAFELRFSGGVLEAVRPLGFCDRSGLRLPPFLVAPLLLGWRSYEELRFICPDLSASGMWRSLVDVLFPKVDSFIYTVY